MLGRAEELAEFLSDRTLLISFNQTVLSAFWLSVEDEYLLQKATRIACLLSLPIRMKHLFQLLQI